MKTIFKQETLKAKQENENKPTWKIKMETDPDYDPKRDPTWPGYGLYGEGAPNLGR